jgi:hypothetical protein
VLPRAFWFELALRGIKDLYDLCAAVATALHMTWRERRCLRLRLCGTDEVPSEERVVEVAAHGQILGPSREVSIPDPKRGLVAGAFLLGTEDLSQVALWNTNDIYRAAGWRVALLGPELEPPPGLRLLEHTAKAKVLPGDDSEGLNREGPHDPLLGTPNIKRRQSSISTVRNSFLELLGATLGLAKVKPD